MTEHIYKIQFSQGITPSHQLTYSKLGIVRRVASDIRTSLGADSVMGILDRSTGTMVEIYGGEIPAMDTVITYRKAGETVERKRTVRAWKVAQRRRLIENARSFMMDCYPAYEDQLKLKTWTDKRVIMLARRAAGGNMRSLVKMMTPYKVIYNHHGVVTGYPRAIRTFKSIEGK